jgi:acyl carrier protein
MRTIEQRVVHIVSEQLGVAPADVKLSHHFVNDLGADDIDQVELLMCIEDEFELEIGTVEADDLTTVQKVLDYVSSHVRA